MQELRKRFPTPFRLRRKASGQKFLVGMTLRPLSFLFARLLEEKISCDGAVYFSITKVNNVVLQVFSILF
jgi:hypothetical protein